MINDKHSIAYALILIKHNIHTLRNHDFKFHTSDV